MGSAQSINKYQIPAITSEEYQITEIKATYRDFLIDGVLQGCLLQLGQYRGKTGFETDLPDNL